MSAEFKGSKALSSIRPTDVNALKILSDIEGLPDLAKKQLFKYLWAVYPTEISTHAQLKSAVKTAIHNYNGGFFGVSVRRRTDIAAIEKFCSDSLVEEGRSLKLAFQIFKYAKENIITGFFNRSDLRDKLVAALESVDPFLVAALEDLQRQNKLTQAGVVEIAAAHPSVMHVPSLNVSSKTSQGSAEIEMTDSFQDGLMERDESNILARYRESME